MYLHIVDLSNALYAGMSSNKWVSRGVREVNGEWEANQAHVGAILFSLKILREMMGPESVVIPVIERTPHIKRKMYEEVTGDEYGYKAGRKEKPAHFDDIKDYLEWVLRDLGFPVQYAEGYEADDIIYTLVELYKNDFEKIFVHTKDSDLYFLVSDNVEIAKVGEQGKVITLENYSRVVAKDVYMWYNTIHLSKLYKGDSSDNIPGIGKEWAPRIDALISEEDYPKLGNLDLVRSYLRKASIEYAECAGSHLLVPIFNLVVPLKVPEELLDLDEYDVDKYKLDDYYLRGFDQKADKWNLDEKLRDYIDKFYE